MGVQKLVKRFHISKARGVAFLDPYGTHLHWQTVKALADTRKVDVIINFPVWMAIIRMIRNSGDILESDRQKLDMCFGTHEWFDLAYEEPEADLFGTSEMQKSEAAASRLLDLYQGRLKSAFGNVVKPSLVRNTRGSPLYYLMWASSNATGIPITKHIMGLGDWIKPPKR